MSLFSKKNSQPKRSLWNHFFPKIFSWFRRRPEALTVLLMTKGHLEVKKLHLSPQLLSNLKVVGALGGAFFIASIFILAYFLVNFPEKAQLSIENRALKTELNKLQFHLDTLQTTVDRVGRFNQKLRELTDVDKEFEQARGPLGQGGGDSVDGEEVFDFGDYEVDSANLKIDEDSPDVLSRRDRFLVQKLYTWVSRLYQGAELETQSVEELYEVLKGREFQLASTPSILPAKGWVTSHFGYRIDPFTGRRALHKGLDVVARRGTPIIAPADGVVSFAGRYGSYGNTVMVFHGYGVSTLYAHTEDLIARVGQQIKRGDVLATVGTTGRSTGPHLHYEVIVHGVKVDPRKYVLDRSL